MSTLLGLPFRPGSVIVKCSCERVYSRRKWLALPKPPKGDRQVVPFDPTLCNCDPGPKGHQSGCEANGYTLIFRNCECGSTMAVESTLLEVAP